MPLVPVVQNGGGGGGVALEASVCQEEAVTIFQVLKERLEKYQRCIKYAQSIFTGGGRNGSGLEEEREREDDGVGGSRPLLLVVDGL